MSTHRPPAIAGLHPITAGLIAIALLCIVIAMTGCAVHRPALREVTTITTTNGTVTTTDRRMKVTTAAIWPADSQVSKTRTSLGRTWSTGANSIDVDGVGGTNGVEALRVIDSILGKVHP